MNEEERNRLAEKIDAGLKFAIATALEEHRRAGRLVAIMREGRVVLVVPEPAWPESTSALREQPPQK
jgi:hypothetical protein